MLQALKDHLELIAAIITAITVIAGVPPFRKGAVWMWMKIWNQFVIPNQILAEIIAIRQDMAETKRVNQSLTAIVARCEGQRIHWFRMQARPAMEMDTMANVTLVSKQTIHLFKVVDENDLKGVSYQKFLDPRKVDDFNRSFMWVAERRSKFAFNLELFDSRRESLGMWEIAAEPLACEIAGEPLAPELEGEVLYVANFTPLDPVAKSIAGRRRWTLG